MSGPLTDRYRRWFTYEIDAHDRTVRSLDGVPDAGKSTPEYRRAVDILAHVARARLIWLSRLGVGTKPDGIFPKGFSLEQVKAELNAAHDLWIPFLDGLDDPAAARPFEYRSIDGNGFRNTLDDVLAQLFGHSCYHRGQIAMLVRQAGGEPAITDFIYWSREPLGDAPAS